VLSDKIAVMSEGKLQQFSSPKDTYNRPANQFVAGFIGSPRMNFLDGDLTVENDAAMLRGRISIAIPGDSVRRIAASRGGPMVAGVRPEHIRLNPDATVGAQGVVELLEPVGPVTYADFTMGGVPLRASVPASAALESGQTVGVSFEPDQFHLFDKTTGVRIDIA